ncbi:MAG: alpha/beta hydrolase [Solirubrobacterales bacterium]|nr:alpha/beta hydrolase [Solirubrobacterales bacterium]
MPDEEIPLEVVELHGKRLAYRRLGSGPVLLLVHGITNSSASWRPVMRRLAEAGHTVLAPDLPGHGTSERHRGDHSLGAHASILRDLLQVLGLPRVTVVGHSLGGGVAMVFSYQFPERVERLALVASGGLGREVSPLIRAATLPGAEQVIRLATVPPVLRAVGAVGAAFGRLGLKPGSDLAEMAGGVASLGDGERRAAFVRTARSIASFGGQRVSATDRLYLAAQVPVLLLWGEQDPIIPVDHGRAAHAALAGSRLELFPHAGHFPMLDEPERFVALVHDWMATTEPTAYDEERLGQVIRARADRGAA